MTTRHKIIAFDLETGGLNKYKNPILEIAAVACYAGTWESIETFEAKVQFRVEDASETALGITKFSPSAWERYALPPNVVAKKFSLFCKKHATLECVRKDGTSFTTAELMAYNAKFDSEFLREWYRKQKMRFCAHPRVLCGMQKIIWFYRDNPSIEPPENFKLGTVCSYLGVDADPNHTALADTLGLIAAIRRTREIELSARLANAA